MKLPPEVHLNSWFYLAIIPDCSTDPGYPGGADWYERKLTLQAWLEVRGTLDA